MQFLAIFDPRPPGTQYDVIVTMNWSLLRTHLANPPPPCCVCTKKVVPEAKKICLTRKRNCLLEKWSVPSQNFDEVTVK